MTTQSSTDIDNKDIVSEFEVFVITVNLIKQVIHSSDIIAAEDTYKLNNEGYPVLMIGTVEYSKQYHPYGVSD